MASERPGPRPEPNTAIVALTRNGARLALQLQAELPGATCFVPERHRFALAVGAVGYDRLGALLPTLWTAFDAFVCIMASGIIVRQIAPLLRHKASDPAVVVVDERGRFAISLVSGHLGGANALARRVARLVGAQPVITTASDVQQKPALDLIARAAGLEIGNADALSRLARAMLEDEPIWLYDPEERLSPHLAGVRGLFPLAEADVREGRTLAPPEAVSQGHEPHAAHAGSSPPGIWVSERRPPAHHPCLALHPRTLVVGLGCNRGTESAEILGLLQAVFHREGLSLCSIRNLASVDIKADEPGLLAVAAALDRPIRFFSREEIQPVTVPNPSPLVAKHIGVPSVCEATALLSAQSSLLLVPKQKTPNVTLAVVRAASPS